MKRNLVGALFFLWALFMTPAFASVVINEVAWMGTDVSSTNEWIELFNQDSRAVELSGWKIEASDGSPIISLSGTIAANGYFLIERTDDATVPGIAADVVVAFGNGLSNSGETLRLLDARSATVDTVTGGTDWVNIGGDNVSKETAQRTMNSWLTGVATPRAQNVVQAGEVKGATTNTNTTSSTNSLGGATAPTTTSPATPTTQSKSSVVAETYPRKNIVVSAGEDKSVFALFSTTFKGVSTGLYGESLDTATYRWNFGDGVTAEGKTVSHVYEFPGEYVVTLEVFWSTYRATDRLAVLVTAPDVIMAKVVPGEGGYIEFFNRSNREIDLSGWVLKENDTPVTFIFPPNSVILAKKSFILSSRVSRVSSAGTNFLLHYPDGGVAFQTEQKAPEVRELTMSTSSKVKVYVGGNIPKTEKNNVGGGAVLGSATTTSETVLWEKDSTQLGAGVLSRGYEITGGLKWFYVLLITILIILAGFMLARSHRADATPADEYAIIEDIIEGRGDLKESR